MRELGEYQIEREWSPGSFLARGPAGRPVVLKVLEDDCLLREHLHPLIKDRLCRVRELAHLGVANLLGAERSDATCFLVWEYVEGTPLADLVEQGRLAPLRLRHLARDLVQSVESLHALGIVHGALHGRNVIVQPNGTLRLTHVSPLLYNDPASDIHSLVEMFHVLGCLSEEESEQAASLRQLASLLSSPSAGPAAVNPPGRDNDRRLRMAAFVGAIAVMLAGSAVAWGLWRYGSQQESEPPADVRPATPAPAGGGL